MNQTTSYWHRKPQSGDIISSVHMMFKRKCLDHWTIMWNHDIYDNSNDFLIIQGLPSNVQRSLLAKVKRREMSDFFNGLILIFFPAIEAELMNRTVAVTLELFLGNILYRLWRTKVEKGRFTPPSPTS